MLCEVYLNKTGLKKTKNVMLLKINCHFKNLSFPIELNSKKRRSNTREAWRILLDTSHFPLL